MGTCPDAGQQAGTGSGVLHQGKAGTHPVQPGGPAPSLPLCQTPGVLLTAPPQNRAMSPTPTPPGSPLSSPSPGIFTLVPFPSLTRPRSVKEKDFQRDAGGFQRNRDAGEPRRSRSLFPGDAGAGSKDGRTDTQLPHPAPCPPRAHVMLSDSLRNTL